MTIDELIEELLKLKNEGKGEYKAKSSCWGDVFDLDKPIVFDDVKEIYL
jgi:tRNA(Phe) wybutosine-synthesizing methylase Tyw3